MTRNKKIVIVDDFTGVRSIVRESLERRGFTILEATDGAKALKFFDGTQIDLLITDYDMPEVNGADLVRTIRGLDRYTYTPVVMISGVKKDRIEDKISDLNIACFLQKPFDMQHFYSVVDRLA